MKKKLVVLMLSAAMTATLLTGCGDTKETTSESTATETEAEATEEAADDSASDQEAADKVAALIDQIYVQERNDKTDEQCKEAKEAWDKLTDAQKELDELPTSAQLKERYQDTSRWDARLQAALHKRRPVLKRVLVAAMTLVILTLGALAVSADFRRAVYTMIQKFLPIEMQLTYQVDGEPLEQLPNGYSDHYVPDGFEMDDAQKFERAENFLHVYSSKETEESYTVRCSIIQPGQQALFDNEHTVYETVKVGEADGVLGTSTDEHGKNVYTLSWEYQGITHTVMGNIPYDEIMKIAEGIR